MKKIPMKTIVCVVVLAVLAVCFLPFPTRINMTMQSCQVTEDGTVVDEGEIVIKGWKLNYLFRQDTVRFTELKFHELEAYTRSQPAANVSAWPSNQDDSSFDYTYNAIFVRGEYQGSYTLSLRLSTDLGWCYADIESVATLNYSNYDKQFVGTTGEIADYQEIMEYFNIYTD